MTKKTSPINDGASVPSQTIPQLTASLQTVESQFARLQALGYDIERVLQ